MIRGLSFLKPNSLFHWYLGGLDPRHNLTLLLRYLPVSVFTQKTFQDKKREVAYCIRFGFHFIPFGFRLLQVLIKDASFAITSLISKTDEGTEGLKDHFCSDDQTGCTEGPVFSCYPDMLPLLLRRVFGG